MQQADLTALVMIANNQIGDNPNDLLKALKEAYNKNPTQENYEKLYQANLANGLSQVKYNQFNNANDPYIAFANRLGVPYNPRTGQFYGPSKEQQLSKTIIQNAIILGEEIGDKDKSIELAEYFYTYGEFPPNVDTNHPTIKKFADTMINSVNMFKPVKPDPLIVISRFNKVIEQISQVDEKNRTGLAGSFFNQFGKYFNIGEYQAQKSAIKGLMNILVFAEARSLNGPGPLTKADVEMAAQVAGDVFTSDTQFKHKLKSGIDRQLKALETFMPTLPGLQKALFIKEYNTLKYLQQVFEAKGVMGEKVENQKTTMLSDKIKEQQRIQQQAANLGAGFSS